MKRDPLVQLAIEINHAHHRGANAAEEIGEALARAKELVGWRLWPEWVERNCVASPEAVAHYLSGFESGTPPVPARVDQTVICGWCSFSRRERGLKAKILSGPEDGPRVVHGRCVECEQALEAKLSRFPRVEKWEYEGKEGLLDTFSSNEWNVACGTLEAAFFHADQVLEAARTLRELQGNPGLSSGVLGLSVELVTGFESLKRLAAELTLLSREEDPDVESLQPGSEV